MKGVGWVLAIFIAGFSALASAQDKTVDRTAQGQAGKDVRVDVYINVQDDDAPDADRKRELHRYHLYSDNRLVEDTDVRYLNTFGSRMISILIWERE